jgi:hypothetical protein
MAGDAGESLDAMDVRLDSLKLSAGDRLAAASAAAARRAGELTATLQEALRRAAVMEQHTRDLEAAIARAQAEAGGLYKLTNSVYPYSLNAPGFNT